MTSPDDKWFDLTSEHEGTQAFIQWKGTDVCMDFYCDCGAEPHVDGFFASNVKCFQCGTIWQMPTMLFPRKVEEPQSPVYETTAEMAED
ncbi:hypothetical protein [Phenylobacterium immobile]|uniref:hypothetical protein n=1 Tax=Phenylobacterium immobile TaxID=21 RepID=UPI000A8FF2AF|nr:hypothetical protein [Phenylobacterium immobile]